MAHRLSSLPSLPQSAGLTPGTALLLPMDLRCPTHPLQNSTEHLPSLVLQEDCAALGILEHTLMTLTGRSSLHTYLLCSSGTARSHLYLFPLPQSVSQLF